MFMRRTNFLRNNFVQRILCNNFVAVKLHYIISMPTAYVTYINPGFSFSGHVTRYFTHTTLDDAMVTRLWCDSLYQRREVRRFGGRG